MTKIEEPNKDFVEFVCAYCNSLLSFHESKLGTAQECPFCYETVVVVPASSGRDSKLPLPVLTLRLKLRGLTMEDLADWSEIVMDDDSYKYLHFNAAKDEEAKNWLETGIVRRITQPQGYLTLGIESLNDAKIIGYLSLYFRDPGYHRQGTFDIMIHPACRRRGYGTEAVKGLFEFGFSGIGLHDIRANIDMQNCACRRMAEKAGMRVEGEFQEARQAQGIWVSEAYYVIFAQAPQNTEPWQPTK